MQRLLLAFLLMLPVLSGCSRLPGLHTVTIQQGNVITQDMIDQLRPGMTRAQVAFIMGEPVVRNTFNSGRWDYVYSIESRRYSQPPMRVSLFFVDELLSHFTGDLAPTSAWDARSAATADQASTDS